MVISDAPPAAISFPLRGKRYGRKGALGRVWCVLPLDLGENRCFDLAFHTVVTLRASDYAPPDTVGIKFDASCFRMIAINRRYVGNPDGCYLLARQIVGAGLCSARSSDELSTRGRSRAPPLQGAEQIKKDPCKKVQSNKSRLHLLFAANMQR